MQFTYVVVDLSKIPVDVFLSAGYSVIFDNGRYVVLK
jgi:hypothetical protein